MTEKEQRETNNVEMRKRRSLGCAFWGALLGLGCSLFFVVFSSVIYSWQLGRNIPRNLIEILLQALAIGLVIAIPIAAVIGYFTKVPKNKLYVYAVFSIAFIGWSLALYWFVHKMCLFGESGHPCPGLIETPLSLLIVLIAGLFLGLLGGYGYWRAGRRSYSKK